MFLEPEINLPDIDYAFTDESILDDKNYEEKDNEILRIMEKRVERIITINYCIPNKKDLGYV